jgi:hypothetical protein
MDQELDIVKELLKDYPSDDAIKKQFIQDYRYSEHTDTGITE